MKLETEIAGRKLCLETGELARQANGAVVVTYGDTVVLATVVSAPLREGRDGDFFPLTVDYRERMYAAGKIPGGFFKREGRPREKEILSSRIIDRCLRPLFFSNFNQEVQIMSTVLSCDRENDPDLISIIASSAAILVSPIPFPGPVGAVRVGKIDGQWVINPTVSQLEDSRLDLVIAGTGDKINMLEGIAWELGEEEIVSCLELAHPYLKKSIDLQTELMQKVNPVKMILAPETVDNEFLGQVKNEFRERVKEALLQPLKKIKEEKLESVAGELKTRFPEREKEIKKALEDTKQEIVKTLILNENKRVDGRAVDQIRPITCKVGVLPRTHGSGLFMRGETQALVAATLGSSADMQIMDDLEKEYKKRFMLHYNFPPFSTGEVKPNRGPGRREIGHGVLAERSIIPVLPVPENFPYTIRLVSDILESNGSSSMASVCGSSLALMDAGVPITSPVAGVALGLISEGDRKVILTDIMGYEDHFGEMDFKVAGTRQGITAIQVDVKNQGLTLELIKDALSRARDNRGFILDKISEVISAPRADLSIFAPKVVIMKIATERIKDVIGPGGKVIKRIIEETGVEIDIESDGKVLIYGEDSQAVAKARGIVEGLTAEPELGRTYKGKVMRIMPFGAFVEILPGREGLVHISQLAEHRVAKVEDVVKEGDQIMVKLVEIDNQGRLNLSRKEVLKQGIK